jgi:hypothetical protein
VDEPPQRLGCQLARRHRPDDVVGEPFQAELAAVTRPGLGHPVGVHQHPVAGPQRDLVGLPLSPGEQGRLPHRRIRLTPQGVDEQPLAADEQRGGMPAVAPPQHSGGQVQLGQDARAELVGQPVRQRVVDALD